MIDQVLRGLFAGFTAGVRVFVEPKALFHVVGTTMDFLVSLCRRCSSRSPFNDLTAWLALVTRQTSPVSSEFVFDNPNAKGSCGCGESFNV